MVARRRHDESRCELCIHGCPALDVVKGPMVVINAGISIFQVSAGALQRPLNTLNLEESPDSCDRTRAPVLWLSCEGQKNVSELFTDNSYLSAILDRQGLMFATPADLRTKKTEGFTPQALHGFWAKVKMKNPQIVGMSSTVFNKYT